MRKTCGLSDFPFGMVVGWGGLSISETGIFPLTTSYRVYRKQSKKWKYPSTSMREHARGQRRMIIPLQADKLVWSVFLFLLLQLDCGVKTWKHGSILPCFSGLRWWWCRGQNLWRAPPFVRATTAMLCGTYLRLGELADREKLGVLKLHDTKRGIYWKFVYSLEVTDVTQLFRHEWKPCAVKWAVMSVFVNTHRLLQQHFVAQPERRLIKHNTVTENIKIPLTHSITISKVIWWRYYLNGWQAVGC